MTGKQPNISKMNVFKSQCFSYQYNKKKLDHRSKSGIFVGYDDESLAYLIYFPDNQTVKKSRCVKFTSFFDNS